LAGSGAGSLSAGFCASSLSNSDNDRFLAITPSNPADDDKQLMP
jgi:hypothetical protein